MTSKHSPTPWHEETGSFEYVIDAHGEQVALVGSKESAAHIVKCVNAHDGLVAALKALLHTVDMHTDGHDAPAYDPKWNPTGDKAPMRAAAHEARALLAKIGGAL